MRDKVIFSSDKYDIYVDFWYDDDGRALFEVGAACKRTGRTSSVTTVDEVMSYFGANPDKKRFQDSTWRLKNKEVGRFKNRACMLIIMDDLSWLDEALDEDRIAGEWENLIGGE